MAPTIRPMTVAELSSPMYCANRAEKSCVAAARVWVAGTPYCKRCGNRVSKSIVGILAQRSSESPHGKTMR
jgi:hypothetical protein